MPFLSGSITLRRYRVLDALPPNWREAFEQRMQAGYFTESYDTRSIEPNAGWIRIGDPGSGITCLDDWSFNNDIALGIRVDSKRVNGKLLKIETDKRIREVMSAKGLERLSAAHRREIREAVLEDLTARALPAVKVFELIWRVDAWEIWICTSNAADTDSATALFHDSAAVTTQPFRLADWLATVRPWDEIEVAGSVITGNVQSSLPLPEPERFAADPFDGHAETLASEFALWLWWQTECLSTFELAGGPVDVWIDDAMTFRSVEDQPVTNAFKGGAPSTTPEAKLSILSGKGIRQMRIGVCRGESEWAATLLTGPAGISLAGVRLPCVVKEGIEEMIYERIFLLDALHGIVAELLARFIAARSGEWAPVADEIQSWLMGNE